MQRAYNVVPAPFHNPGIPSARQTCRMASKKPFTRSVRNIPWSHTQTTSPSSERRAAVDIRRTQGEFAGWQHTFGGGREKRGCCRTGWVCRRVFTTSNGVTVLSISVSADTKREQIRTGQRCYGRACRSRDQLCTLRLHCLIP